MVFQNYALYPHMTVARISASRCELAGVPRPRSHATVASGARILGLEPLLDRNPRSFPAASGSASPWAGRSSANPKVFLFDEPLSNLDAKLRVQMRVEITQLHAPAEATTIYVTHDQVEAMTMADKIVVHERRPRRAGRRARLSSTIDPPTVRRDLPRFSRHRIPSGADRKRALPAAFLSRRFRCGN